jgi:site-specific recombinase XerD
MWSPQFECVVGEDGEASYRVGHELIDGFLEFIAARARPNTVKAYAHDLKIFFTIVAKEPSEVTSRDVLGFVTRLLQRRQPGHGRGRARRGHHHLRL